MQQQHVVLGFDVQTVASTTRVRGATFGGAERESECGMIVASRAYTF